MKRWTSALLLGVLLVGSAGADDPPSKAATKPAAEATLLGGIVHYAPPEEWKIVVANTNDTTATYIATDHDGLLSMQVLPPNAAIDAAAGRALVIKLRQNHKLAKQEIALEPRLEPDDAFALRIHERYKDKEGKVVDELHLYRQVGGRAVMLTVQSLSKDEDHIRDVHKIGEDMLTSATFQPKKRGKRE
ncbi:MAG: hypothetical protein JWN51_1044 [Phycisphaerales bacterium]|nr:hypothetical protein [Phycisphaerales bacterium]